MTYPFKDFCPPIASEKELRAFVRYWLKKPEYASHPHFDLVQKLLKAKGSMLSYIGTAIGTETLAPNPDHPTHCFQILPSEMIFCIIEYPERVKDSGSVVTGAKETP